MANCKTFCDKNPKWFHLKNNQAPLLAKNLTPLIKKVAFIVLPKFAINFSEFGQKHFKPQTEVTVYSGQ